MTDSAACRSNPPKGNAGSASPASPVDGDAASLDNASFSCAKPMAPSLVDLYRQYCQEAACRANSALLAVLSAQQSPSRPLSTLCIPHSYLGPKGLIPVMRLVAHCQTLEVLDLRGNGIDNEGAGLICQTLTAHLGIMHLQLDGNPLTNDGGRRLMQLVERNPRILTLTLNDTDVYDSLRERIGQALSKRGGGGGGVLKAGSGSGSNSTSPVAAAPVAAVPPPLQLVPSKPPASAPQQRSSTTSGRPVGSASSAAGIIGKAPSVSLIGGRGHSPSTTSTTENGVVAARSASAKSAVVLDTPMPKPPPPAIASRDYATRMTDQQRSELLRKYEERAKTYEAVATSDASRAADRMRLELMRVEQHRTASPDGVDVEDRVRRLSRPSSAAHTATHSVSESLAGADGGNNNNMRATVPAGLLEPSGTLCFETRNSPTHQGGANTTTTTTAATRAARKSKAGLANNNNNTSNNNSHAGGGGGVTLPWSVTELPLKNDDPLRSPHNLTEDESSNGPPTVASSTGDFNNDDGPNNNSNNTALIINNQMSLVPMTLSKEEQFKQLFAKGCALYNERKLDAAYLSWNEALEIAVSERNREWMAVVSSNLQRLSYELLVAEGAKHLETYNLEDADKTFQLALDVAVKSKNAAWEAEMIRAKRNVQQAVFQRSHESALLLFEKAKNVRDQPLTTDDRFVEAGSDGGELLTHTSAFVTEWARLLYVKEAMEMWSDAAMVARRIGGASTRHLLDIVSTAVSNVAALLTKKFLIPEPSANHLPLQGTSRFSHGECVKLIALWTDLVSKSQTTLGNRTWDAIAAAELGHLYLATHQLPQALQCFERVVDFGAAVQSTLLMGCGHTYVGLVHWQRSNFAVAERSFLAAMEYWKHLRLRGVGDARARAMREDGDDDTSLTAVKQVLTKEGESSPSGDHNNNNNNVAPSSSTNVNLEAYITADYVNSMISRCYYHLVGLLVSTHRYREALETLEQSLLHQYDDRLHEKLLRNFTPKPTLDHITAVAASVDTPLLYYEVSYRFEWNAAKEQYDTTQHLFTWVVPKAGDIKVVTMDVSREFGVLSIESVLQELRTALCVDPLSRVEVGNHIHDRLPENAWMPALRLLYRMFLYPISDFLRVQDSESSTTRLGTLTIIPSKILWTVPFNALLNSNTNRYLIEDYSIQLSFSAVQLAFAVLSARRVQERGLTKRAVVVQPETDMGVHQTAALDVAFPFDAARSLKEGQRVAESFAASPTTTSRRKSSTANGASTTNTTGGASSNLAEARDTDCLVENYDMLMDLLPKLRFLHLAVATTSHGAPPIMDSALSGQRGDLSTGGFYVATEGFEELRFVRSSEISQRDLFTELVVLSSTNISVEKTRGTREGILNLVRAFLCSGVASVMAGIWCTPDMLPAELFEQVYRCMLTKERHKAKALALAIRYLLTDDRMRFAPRLWSGYFAVGCPIV